MTLQFYAAGGPYTTPNLLNGIEYIQLTENTLSNGIPDVDNLNVSQNGNPVINIYISGSGFQSGWTGSLTQSGPQQIQLYYKPINNNYFNIGDSLLFTITGSAGLDSGITYQWTEIVQNFANLSSPIVFPDYSGFSSNGNIPNPSDFRFGILITNTSGTSGTPILQSIYEVINGGSPILAYSASLGGFQSGYTGYVSNPDLLSNLFWIKNLSGYGPTDTSTWQASYLATGNTYYDLETVSGFQYAVNASTGSIFNFTPPTSSVVPSNFTLNMIIDSTVGFGIGNGSGLYQAVYIVNNSIPQFAIATGTIDPGYTVFDTGGGGGGYETASISRNTDFSPGDQVYISLSDQSFFYFGASDNAYAFYTISGGGPGPAVCSDLITQNSILMPDGTITQLKSNLSQFTDKNGCITLAPFILGVKGLFNMRNLNAPYICVGDITRTNVSGTHFPLGHS